MGGWQRQGEGLDVKGANPLIAAEVSRAAIVGSSLALVLPRGCLLAPCKRVQRGGSLAV